MTAVLLGYGLWRLAVFVAVIAGIGLYLWDGTLGAREACIAHDFGAPGLNGAVACAVAH